MSGTRGVLSYNYGTCVKQLCQRLQDADNNLLCLDGNSFLSMLNFSVTGMAMLSIDGRWLRANQSICDLFGYTEEELRQLTYQELTHPEDLIRGKEDARKLIVGDIPCMQIEKRYRHRNGHYIWTKLTTSLVRDHDGKALYFASQIENIEQRKQAEQEISLLSFALNKMSDMTLLIEEAGHFKYVNDQSCSELGYSREELLSGMRVPDIDPDYQMLVWREHWAQLKQFGSLLFETIHKSKAGKIYPVEVSANYVEYDGCGYNFAFVRIITERKRAELARLEAKNALRESEERFRQVTENIEDVIWLSNAAKTKMFYINPAYELVWGLSCESLYTHPGQWMDIIHPDDKYRVERAVNSLAGGEYDTEYRIIRPDGCIRNIHDRAFPIKDAAGKVFRLAGVARDITRQKQQEAHIQYLAYHDSLTGLPNRTLVLNYLKLAITQAHRQQQMLAVLFLDLDRFKTINDTLGHLAGDELLKQASDCWAKVLGAEDVIGRFGGDEFIILLPNLTEPEQAAHRVAKLLDVLTAPFNIANREIHISSSAGISIYPRDADNAETLVKYADTSLYLAKEQGRNTYRFFSPELDIQVHQRLRLENDLRSARDKKQLYLLYQPLIDVSSGRYIGVEALLRWQHPEHGLISPADFIPVAEETGQIIPIGEWVLRTACSQLCVWLKSGASDFRVSVNLSRRQLEHAQLTETLQRILNETGCPAHCLELEITESATMSNPEAAIVKLNALHGMDIRLALDDYGTGYSSLAYLKRFPLDRLKIDRSFVNGIPADKDDVTIVQTTIVMARQLGLKVVAEGVETASQRDFLHAYGCDEIQGYLYGKPMPAEEIAQHCGF